MILTALLSSGLANPSTINDKSQITTSPSTVPVDACVKKKTRTKI
jgi:hypothetical protein